VQRGMYLPPKYLQHGPPANFRLGLR